MSNLEQAVSDLARELGVQVLAPGASVNLQFRFESGARVGFACRTRRWFFIGRNLCSTTRPRFCGARSSELAIRCRVNRRCRLDYTS